MGVCLYCHGRVYFRQLILLGASQLGIELHCRVLLRIVYGNTYARVPLLPWPCAFPTIQFLFYFIGRVTTRNRITVSCFITKRK